MYHIKQILSLRTRLTIAAGLLAVLALLIAAFALGSRQVGRDLDSASALTAPGGAAGCGAMLRGGGQGPRQPGLSGRKLRSFGEPRPFYRDL